MTRVEEELRGSMEITRNCETGEFKPDAEHIRASSLSDMPSHDDSPLTFTPEKNSRHWEPESKTKSKKHTSVHQLNRASKLETLPPEIRRHLLSVLDLPRLQALIHASPAYHQQYLFDRAYLLRSSLGVTLGPVIIDAYAVQAFKPKEEEGTEGRQKILHFLQSHSPITDKECLAFTQNLAEDAVWEMCSYYLRIVRPVSEHFASSCLQNLSQQEDVDCASIRWKEANFSFSETARFARATYRFQLLCELASPARGLSGPPADVESLVDSFLGIIEPWETEEILSFYQYSYGNYERWLEKVTWDLHPDNPKFDDQGRPPTPTGAFDLSNGCKIPLLWNMISLY